MSNHIVLSRVFSRFGISMALAMAIAAILLSMVFYSHRLANISEAGWAVIGSLGTFLGQSLVAIARAVAQNPSDRSKPTEED